MIKLKDRTLLRNGISLVDIRGGIKYANQNNGVLPDHIRFGTHNFDQQEYDKMMNVNSFYPMVDPDDPVPQIQYTDEEWNDLVEHVISYRRKTFYGVATEQQHLQRVEMEMEFFVRKKYEGFLCLIRRIIQSFKDNNIVWGIGRGSACASYVMFLLEVHDSQTVVFDLPFKEFSKEK